MKIVHCTFQYNPNTSTCAGLHITGDGYNAPDIVVDQEADVVPHPVNVVDYPDKFCLTFEA